MIAPTEIRIDKATRALTLAWPSGNRQRLSAVQLRRMCPCAECRRKRMLGEHIEPTAQLELDQLHPITYGVQIGFSDGHARGIYPWVYLSQFAYEGG